MRRDGVATLSNQRAPIASAVTEERTVDLDAAIARADVVESLRTGIVLVDALEYVREMNAAAESRSLRLRPARRYVELRTRLTPSPRSPAPPT